MKKHVGEKGMHLESSGGWQVLGCLGRVFPGPLKVETGQWHEMEAQVEALNSFAKPQLLSHYLQGNQLTQV